MNLSKSIEFFDPNEVTQRIHIIGCGSVGSTIAELLARFGLENFSLYDFDTVEAKNIVNQMFTVDDIGLNKTECTARIIKDINPDANITLHPDGYVKQKLSGYVFLCVDNIEVRKQIVKDNKLNTNIKAMFDFRTSLMDAQHYAADWSKPDLVDNLYASMDFTHEEAAELTPVSACGTTLGVAPTVRAICNAGVCNFVNFTKNEDIKKYIYMNPFTFVCEAY